MTGGGASKSVADRSDLGSDGGGESGLAVNEGGEGRGICMGGPHVGR